MGLKLSELRKCVGALKLTRRTNDLTIDLFFLTRGLKPSILWDYGTTQPQLLARLGGLIGGDIIIMVLGSDYLISYKTRLQTLLNSFPVNPPVLLDVSESLATPVLASREALDNTRLMVQSVQQQIVASNDELVVEIAVEDSWNLTTLFGILLGFPVVYYYDTSGGNCLGNLDLAVWRVGGTWAKVASSWPVSFSVPCELEEVVERRVRLWWEGVGEGKEWGINYEKEDLIIITETDIANMPFLAL